MLSLDVFYLYIYSFFYILKYIFCIFTNQKNTPAYGPKRPLDPLAFMQQCCKSLGDWWGLISRQIHIYTLYLVIATSHGRLVREIPLFQRTPLISGKSSLVKYYNLARLYTHMYVLVGDLSSTLTTFHSCWEGLMCWRNFPSCLSHVDTLKVPRKFPRCSMGLEYFFPCIWPLFLW